MIPRDVRNPTHSRCRCCSAGVEETTQHALFECVAHDEPRNEFLERAEAARPGFGVMPTSMKLGLLMSDDTPKGLENIFYRYLIDLFASRERGLESGPAGGRP